MLQYCVTVFVDAAVEPTWRRWMEDHHVPQVLATGCFDAAAIHRVVEPRAPTGQVGYEIHYQTDAPRLERYRKDHAPALMADHTSRFEGRFEASRRVMEHLSARVA